MFQFSDDDPDVESLLDLPLDRSSLAGELNSTKCARSNDLKDILDDCDDNDLILSMIDNVDNSLVDRSLTKDDIGSTHISNANSSNDASKKNVNQSLIEKYITANNVKHKLPSVEPFAPKAPRVEYERKFPGPAGLIPKKSKHTTPVKYQVLPDGSPKQADLPPSKDDFIFENGCWDQLIKDIETSSRLQSIIKENTVAFIKRMNIIRNQPRKLRFFAALITHIDCTVCDPSVVLKDSTGEIHGTLHKELWETYGNLLTVGTAVLLKQASVLSITNSRKLYVNVTSNNLVKLYTPQSGSNVKVTEIVAISEQDLVTSARKSERIVFEETHPNIVKQVKEIPTRKLSPILKTDNVKVDRKECIQRTEFKVKTKTTTFVHSAEFFPKSTNIDQIRNDQVIGDLSGIDADSLFGEF